MNNILKSNKIEDRLIKITLFLSLMIISVNWFFFTKNIKPDLTITPAPPGKHLLKIFSMGDDAFIYRHFGYKIQMSGDDYGTTTPLSKYNYESLKKWFVLLNDFDNQSEFIPSLAGLYFSNSQNPMDNKYIIEYLLEFANQNPEKNWRWLSTAMYLAHFKTKNQELVKDVAKILLSLDRNIVPLWARTIGIFMTKDKDICSSLEMIAMMDPKEVDDIASDKIFGKDNEKNIFLHIIMNRIEELKKNPEAVRKCVNKAHAASKLLK